MLPATPDTIVQYLAAHAKTHSINTLKQRLSALSKFHTDQGFVDPTKAPIAKELLKGIREVHPARAKQAKAIQIGQLSELINWIDQQNRLKYVRDKAFILVGFWRGFRSDEMTRITVERVSAKRPIFELT